MAVRTVEDQNIRRDVKVLLSGDKVIKVNKARERLVLAGYVMVRRSKGKGREIMP